MFIKPGDWAPSNGITLEGTALEVVKSDASLSVLAGPGAGKTELLAQRANFLLSTGACPPPKRILAIAFKVDAARNLQQRVQMRSEPDAAKRFESLTLHAFAKRTLDQFREALPDALRPSADYKIIFPNRNIWQSFEEAHAGDLPEIRSFNASQLAKIVRPIPNFDHEDPTTRERIRQRWWSDCLGRRPSLISFDMIMALATHIVRTQPIIRNAIASTYSHVFLDEFQDVTGAQYELVRLIFQGTGTRLTAVGDTNQAIMGWAGALPEIFDKFGNDFGAQNQKLLFNFRSNSKIVELINDLSHLFTEEELVPTESARSEDGHPPDALEGWIFPDRDHEGAGIARFIKGSLEAEAALRPHDFVILARLRTDEVEARLVSHFTEAGLRLRNDAKAFGPITIQDLVKEPVLLFLASLLKMTHGIREGSPFQVCRDMIAGMEGIDITSDRGAARSLRLVQELVSSVGELNKDITPDRAPFDQLAELAFPNERKDQLSRTFKDYQNREHLEGIINACVEYFRECAGEAVDWPSFIDSVEGREVVKIMTIHKSKGLEYHTVIFTEFNDDAFWNNADDVNVFFVALSRARERIRFSLTQDSKGFKNVSRFLKRLQAFGVEFKEAD